MQVEDVKVRIDPGAAEELARMAAPTLRESAEIIGESIVEQVPVVRGVMKASYSPTVRKGGDETRLYPGSPMWHWMEYGTANNPPYRPIERGVQATGCRYEAS